MSEHNKNFYSLEELKRAKECYEDYQDGEEVYYFVGALRYACDEIERLNNDIKELFRENSNKEKVIIAQDNTIKEVREIFKDYGGKEDIVGYTMYNITGEMLLKLLEILDKEKE